MPARSSWAGRAFSWAQRYQFLSGWLPWISDGLGLIVTLFALVWTFLMAVSPRYFDVPMAALSAAALALFAAKTLKTLLLYPQKVRSGRPRRVDGVHGRTGADPHLRQGRARGSLSPRGSRSCARPNARTRHRCGRCCARRGRRPRCSRPAWRRWSRWRWAAGSTIRRRRLWMVMLAIQSLPYLATLVTAALSAFSNGRRRAAAPGAAAGRRARGRAHARRSGLG